MNYKSSEKTYFMVFSAAIAALYTVLTMVFAPISFGPVQFRISEILCILPFFTPAAIPGLFIGCLLSNFLCGAATLDVIFGSLATLIGAIGSYKLRKNQWLVCVPPILANTIIIPWVLRFAYGSQDLIWYAMITVGIGEILAIGVLGNLLLGILNRYKHVVFGRFLSE
ncbi:QueT transporter family protein [Lacrimispora sp. JR3]|uniref:QueT transporter family protein n=1 Tax=Lacrimispora sinapis TaxID=3111456 RepID=UPI003749862B